MRRRLFERLEQRVERVGREHVHLVDEVHLVATARGGVLDVLEQFAGVVDLGARCRIDLDQVDEPPLVDFTAGSTDAAGRRGDAGFAVQALGKDARNRRLAHSAGAREQEGMMNTVGGERVREGAQDMFLPRELLEAPRAPLACQSGVGHLGTLGLGGREHKGGGPHQLDSGTRHHHYRCSLPGLAEFAAGRREGTNAGRHRKWRRGWDSNPRTPCDVT